jgi:hypothetical protein
VYPDRATYRDGVDGSECFKDAINHPRRLVIKTTGESTNTKAVSP